MATRNNNTKTFLSINRSTEKEAILIVRERKGNNSNNNKAPKMANEKKLVHFLTV